MAAALLLALLALQLLSTHSTALEVDTSNQTEEEAAPPVDLDGVIHGTRNTTLEAILEEAARLERENIIVNRVLMVLGCMAGVVTVLGLGYYWKMGYCTETPS